MLVEFVGCSGSGKTTLANKALAALTSLGYPADYSRRVIARSTCTQWISNERLRNVVLNGVLLPWFAGSLRKHGRFYQFAVPRIRRGAENAFGQINRLRSTMRLISGDELLRRREKRSRLTLVDEGAIGCAHNLFAFAHLESLPEPGDLVQFAELVPAPDVIVHIDVPPELALQRVVRRANGRIPRGGRRRLERFLAAGRAAFHVLAASGKFDDRVLTVVNAGNDWESLAGPTSQIVAFILEHAERNGYRPRLTGSPGQTAALPKVA